MRQFGGTGPWIGPVRRVLHAVIDDNIPALSINAHSIFMERPRMELLGVLITAMLPVNLDVIVFRNVGLFVAWYLWAPGAGPRQKGEIHAEAWPPASTRRILGRYPFHTTSLRSTQGEWIHSPSDVGTEPIHFHQECTA